MLNSGSGNRRVELLGILLVFFLWFLVVIWAFIYRIFVEFGRHYWRRNRLQCFLKLMTPTPMQLVHKTDITFTKYVRFTEEYLGWSPSTTWQRKPILAQRTRRVKSWYSLIAFISFITFPSPFSNWSLEIVVE